MLYSYNITIPANTLESAPTIQKIKLTWGYIHQIDFDIPMGAQNLVGVRIREGLHQLYPTNPAGYITGENVKISFKDFYWLNHTPYNLWIDTFNIDENYDHTIIVRIGVLRPQVNTEINSWGGLGGGAGGGDGWDTPAPEPIEPDPEPIPIEPEPPDIPEIIPPLDPEIDPEEDPEEPDIEPLPIEPVPDPIEVPVEPAPQPPPLGENDPNWSDGLKETDIKYQSEKYVAPHFISTIEPRTGDLLKLQGRIAPQGISNVVDKYPTHRVFNNGIDLVTCINEKTGDMILHDRIVNIWYIDDPEEINQISTRNTGQERSYLVFAIPGRAIFVEGERDIRAVQEFDENYIIITFNVEVIPGKGFLELQKAVFQCAGIYTAKQGTEGFFGRG